MAATQDRTAPFTAIRETPLSPASDKPVRNIVHTVAVPGLTLPAKKGGGPLTVERTYTIEEIDHDWVSVVIDYEFGDEPVVYGNHPYAVGPLREILPDAIPQRPFPKTQRAARDAVVGMLAQQNLGGVVVMPVIDSRTLEIQPPIRVNSAYEERCYFATIREYMPFQADVWWDSDHRAIRVRPIPEGKEFPVVRIA